MNALLVAFLLMMPVSPFSIPTKDKLMIRSELKVGEQTIFPRLLILDGEKASVEIDSLHFELQPSIVGSNDVVIKARVFRLVDGEEELISSPVIKAKLGEKVSITTSEGKKLEMNLKLVAQRSE
ncbi:MAG: hypothetical protein A3F16_08210 [Deltaproteobacteria bacterium RIFCSPHIGHO2_12_FULL_43_9]|nr:MAG: hypothetical protein A3F16_08210 [Deltaproteobacteria bacterium RIFCSPHIGHO2_12_FULL_43_9]